MRVLVCGGRSFDDFESVNQELTWLAGEHPMEVIIHGGARGADTLADEWAQLSRVRVEVYMADWKKHGRAAGPIRNQLMIDEGQPDIVVAFPGGTGTADMVKRAKAAGIEVRNVAGGLNE